MSSNDRHIVDRRKEKIEDKTQKIRAIRLLRKINLPKTSD